MNSHLIAIKVSIKCHKEDAIKSQNGELEYLIDEVLELGLIKLDGFQQPRVKHPKSYLDWINFFCTEKFCKFFQY
jgi:hypothetical protein